MRKAHSRKLNSFVILDYLSFVVIYENWYWFCKDLTKSSTKFSTSKIIILFDVYVKFALSEHYCTFDIT